MNLTKVLLHATSSGCIVFHRTITAIHYTDWGSENFSKTRFSYTYIAISTSTQKTCHSLHLSSQVTVSKHICLVKQIKMILLQMHRKRTKCSSSLFIALIHFVPGISSTVKNFLVFHYHVYLLMLIESYSSTEQGTKSASITAEITLKV